MLLLPRFVWLIPCPDLSCRTVAARFFGRGWAEAVLRGFFLVEDGAARFADGYAMLDFLGADGALGERLGIVEPGFFQIELARGAALEVGDEHGIAGALPFEVGSGDEAALKFFEASARIGEFGFGGRFAGCDEHAVEASLPRVAIDLARDVFGDFAGSDGISHEALVAEINYAIAAADRRDGKGLAGPRRTDRERAEVGAMPRRPPFC